MKKLFSTLVLLVSFCIGYSQSGQTISFSCGDNITATRYSSPGQPLDNGIACPDVNKCKKTYLFSAYEGDNITYNFNIATLPGT